MLAAKAARFRPSTLVRAVLLAATGLIPRSSAAARVAGIDVLGGVTMSADEAKAEEGTVRVRRSGERGHADHGWLNTYHTFSFASYHDPRFDSYGNLRVINEDRVAGGEGFGTHPHRSFGIWSYIVSGALTHKDSMGNVETLRRGAVQFTNAGTGIRHSEYNHDRETCHFLQIWATQDGPDTEPHYSTKEWKDEDKHDRLVHIIAPEGTEAAKSDGAIGLRADLNMFATLLANGSTVTHDFTGRRRGYVHVVTADGSLGATVNGVKLSAGDGAFVEGASRVSIVGEAAEGKRAEVLLFDLK